MNRKASLFPLLFLCLMLGCSAAKQVGQTNQPPVCTVGCPTEMTGSWIITFVDNGDPSMKNFTVNATVVPNGTPETGSNGNPDGQVTSCNSSSVWQLLPNATVPGLDCFTAANTLGDDGPLTVGQLSMSLIGSAQYLIFGTSQDPTPNAEDVYMNFLEYPGNGSYCLLQGSGFMNGGTVYGSWDSGILGTPACGYGTFTAVLQ